MEPPGAVTARSETKAPPLSDDGASRTSVRLLHSYLLRMLLLSAALQAAKVGAVILITRRLGVPLSGLFSQSITLLLPLIVPTIVLAFAVYWAGVYLLEGRALRELPLRTAIPNLLLGTGSGCVLAGLVFGALALQGSVAYEGYAGLDRMYAAATIFAAGVVFEELIFRGVIFRIAEEGFGTAPALVVSAALFSASHVGNEGVSAIGLIALFAGGITLSFAFCLSRNLWWPIGAHLGWNFALGAVFGTAVSGHEARGVFRFALSGPAWLSGGSFGPESSVYAVLCIALGAGALGWLTARHDRWLPSRFRRAAA